MAPTRCDLPQNNCLCYLFHGRYLFLQEPCPILARTKRPRAATRPARIQAAPNVPASRGDEQRIRLRYTTVIEATTTGYSAYAPDLPDGIATGSTVADTENAPREAIAFHLDSLHEDGLAISQPARVPAWPLLPQLLGHRVHRSALGRQQPGTA